MKKLSGLVALAALSLALGACGDKKSTEAAAPSAAPSAAPAPAPETPAAAAAPADAAPAPVADSGLGKSAYNKTCALCHAAGVAGAPKPGDKADWGPRIAQGKDTLYKHALEGFTGAKGMMPARGGNSKMADDDVKAAVDYMVGLSS